MELNLSAMLIMRKSFFRAWCVRAAMRVCMGNVEESERVFSCVCLVEV